MPNPFQILSLAEFDDVLAHWQPRRRITEIHVHCTDRPRRADFRGLATLEAMRKYHMEIGMNDIAQHLTVDPQGLLWTGRPFDAVPASVRGHNGSPSAGPFMIEIVGLFEDGADVLEGDQESSVFASVCAVLRKFEISEAAVKFHREFPNTGKTCPGLGLDPKNFRGQVRKFLAKNTLSHFEVSMPRQLPRAPLTRSALISIEQAQDNEGDWEIPEGDAALAEQAVLAKLIDRGELLPSAQTRDIKEEFRSLIGHVVNTSQGVLSKKGAFHNDIEELKWMFNHRLEPAFASGAFKHIVFYAHGGLVSEKSALCYAKTMLPWWKSYGVYPIFFIWESSLFSTIFKRRRALPARGLADGWDKAVELATQLAARKVWADMKAIARRCAAPMTDFGEPGGLFQFARLFNEWFAPRRDKVQLHAVGHSTGPILHARFMPLLTNANAQFATLNYLAPAIRIDDFQRDVEPLIGAAKPVRQFSVFTMNERAEKSDDVATIYRKSLLYYVRQACEDQDDGRIFGLQEDLFDNPQMKALFRLGKKSDLRASNSARAASIEFSQHEDQPLNPRTTATAHGDFDNNQATMNSVLAGILDVPNLNGIANGARFPSREAFAQCGQIDEADSARALDQTAAQAEAAGVPSPKCGCCCCCCSDEAEVNRAQKKKSAFDLAPGEEDVFETDTGAFHPPAPDPAQSPAASQGRRLAVCVGIDLYPDAPLAGCVNDSRNWAAKLRNLGFEVETLVNEQATRQAMLNALQKLIRNAVPGDELVFQYAGHGTQVEDLNGEELDRFDEALVPVDYRQGELFIDDDIHAETLKLSLAPGANLTFIMDCCHSGSNVRVAPGPVRQEQGDRRNRFMVLPEAAVNAYRLQRSRSRSFRAPPAERDPVPGVVSFAACLDREKALESNGQGDFTRNALLVIDGIIGKAGSNFSFLNAVLKSFGPNREQNPTMIEPAPGLRNRAFLGVGKG